MGMFFGLLGYMKRLGTQNDVFSFEPTLAIICGTERLFLRNITVYDFAAFPGAYATIHVPTPLSKVIMARVNHRGGGGLSSFEPASHNATSHSVFVG